MKTYQEFIKEAGATSARLETRTREVISRDLANRPKEDLLSPKIRPFRGSLKQPQRSRDLSHLWRLVDYSKERAKGVYPETRFPETPVTSRTNTPTTNEPTSRINTPLTQRERDKRRADAAAAGKGTPGPGSLPSGSKLYRQATAGTSVGDNPFDVLTSAATKGKPLPKPRR